MNLVEDFLTLVGISRGLFLLEQVVEIVITVEGVVEATKAIGI